MKEQSLFCAMSPGLAARADDTAGSGTTRESSRAVRSVALAADSVSRLVQRAMSYLESDRRAALRCLHDASTLLGADAPESLADTSAVLSGFQPGGLARWQAKRALTYIEEHLGSRVTVCELAALVSFSKSHFSRAFKRSLGLTPMAYLSKRRVERAKLMMILGESLTEIALACGFADQSHLNRSFRRLVGMSPGLWRRTSAEIHGTDAGWR